MIKKYLLLFLFLPLLATAQVNTASSSLYKGVAVIELFTSQGDINSPEADKLLSEIITDAEKNNKPVFCLSMHVDFWNRYGWKDPFSSFRFTNRLTNYTSVLGQKETYTPFMLLNGRQVLPVNEPQKVFDLIKAGLTTPAVMIPEFTFQIFNDTLDIMYDVQAPAITGKSGSDRYINVAVVEKSLSTKVEKGDNEGKTLRNDNVTRLFYTTDLKTQKGLLRVPLKKLSPGLNKSIIIFIQEKSNRKVLGASSQLFVK
ncbi:MAG: DUF1223 domain-containing protein [Bacteroidota bacterium]|nr:DUF1223 domain-containing protein [Bacteroidota bacterium]